MSKKGHLNIGFAYKPGEVIGAQMNGFSTPPQWPCT